MVWVIGSTGMLGSELCRVLGDKGIPYAGSGSSVSILSGSALEAFAAGKDISFIVNCAAYTAVDKAESEADKARALNADGPENVARLAKKLSVPLIHISTDYLFDGTASSPITEDSPISPIGVYGKTKALGEKAVLDAADDFYILRTAWLYGFHGKNFVYTMIRAMNSRESVRVVSDQRGTPTNCRTLSSVIAGIIGRRLDGGKVAGGVYNVTDGGETTWFGFAEEIFSEGKKSGLITNGGCVISPCSTEEYPTPAKRPAYSVLDKSKIQRELGIVLPDWTESLRSFLNSPLFDKTYTEQ